MKEIMIDNRFGLEWDIAANGTGSVEVINGVLRCSKTSEAGRAYLSIPLPLKHGSKIEVSVLARVVSGSDARLSIDNHLPDGTFEKNEYVKTENKGWTRLILKTELSNSDNLGIRKSRLVVGIWDSLPAGVIEFKDVHVYAENDFASPSVLALGTISKDVPETTWSVEKFFKNYGIISVTEHDANTLRISLENTNRFGSSKPMVVGSLANSKNNVSFELATNTNYILARFSNGTNFLNLSTLEKNTFSFIVLG